LFQRKASMKGRRKSRLSVGTKAKPKKSVAEAMATTATLPLGTSIVLPTSFRSVKKVVVKADTENPAVSVSTAKKRKTDAFELTNTNTVTVNNVNVNVSGKALALAGVSKTAMMKSVKKGVTDRDDKEEKACNMDTEKENDKKKDKDAKDGKEGRFKFDLVASLAKPVKWSMKKGKVGPVPPMALSVSSSLPIPLVQPPVSSAPLSQSSAFNVPSSLVSPFSFTNGKTSTCENATDALNQKTDSHKPKHRAVKPQHLATKSQKRTNEEKALKSRKQAFLQLKRNKA